MAKQIQRLKILDLLKSQEWTCVEEMTKLYIVDYRRRLVDIKRMGYELESRKCTQHSYHGGGSKEWRLASSPKKAPIFIKNPLNGEMVTIEQFALL